jgi:hypothetical protein
MHRLVRQADSQQGHGSCQLRGADAAPLAANASAHHSSLQTSHRVAMPARSLRAGLEGAERG